MQTVHEFYQTLGVGATDEQARACIPPPSDAVAHADLLRQCERCSVGEVAAVLVALRSGYLDARGCDSCFAGIVAAMRGREWGRGVPCVNGEFHEWEWWHIWPDGAPEKREMLERWLEDWLAQRI